MNINLATSQRFQQALRGADADGQKALVKKAGEYVQSLNGVLQDDKVNSGEVFGRLVPLFKAAHAETNPTLKAGLMGLLGDAMGVVRQTHSLPEVLMSRLEQLATTDYSQALGSVMTQATVLEMMEDFGRRLAAEPNLWGTSQDSAVLNPGGSEPQQIKLPHETTSELLDSTMVRPSQPLELELVTDAANDVAPSDHGPIPLSGLLSPQDRYSSEFLDHTMLKPGPSEPVQIELVHVPDDADAAPSDHGPMPPSGIPAPKNR